jgi:hypothetical protein
MPLNFGFRKPKNELEKGGRSPASPAVSEAEMARKCPACERTSL